VKNPTLEDLASTEIIERSTAADPDTVAKLREQLASLTPTTIVTADNGTTTLTMAQLAAEHMESTLSEADRDPMTADEAWEWACRDLVFTGYRVV
jgi:hypothetical protein